jgi:hypothetical protein
MSIDPASMLQAAQAPGARPAGSLRRVLVAGATGRLGEALLNEVLARGGFDDVVALAEGDATMSLGLRGLSLAPLHALPPLDAVLIAQTMADAPDARSFHGRDAPFALVDPVQMPRIAQAAAAAGARSLVLVHPLPAWQQLSALHLGLSGAGELSIAQMPFADVIVLRPVAASASAAGSWLQRVAHVYLSLQLLMMPRSLPVLTSPQVARAAVDLLREPPPGVTVMGAARIAERLERGGRG